MYPGNAASQYKKVGAQTMEGAPPQRIVQALLGGALGKIAAAKGHMQREEELEQGKQIRTARQIIDALKASLDLKIGGEMAQNMDGLYEYMLLQLIDANIKHDASKLDEVSSLLLEIKSAWDQICENGVEPNAAKGSVNVPASA